MGRAGSLTSMGLVRPGTVMPSGATWVRVRERGRERRVRRVERCIVRGVVWW
jgi:hypothetical protein